MFTTSRDLIVISSHRRETDIVVHWTTEDAKWQEIVHNK